jgi:hypothetical protein
VFGMQNLTFGADGGLTEACQVKHPTEPWLCFMSPHMQDVIETPFFMVSTEFELELTVYPTELVNLSIHTLTISHAPPTPQFNSTTISLCTPQYKTPPLSLYAHHSTKLHHYLSMHTTVQNSTTISLCTPQFNSTTISPCTPV